ncbi:MAG: hypothetical protein N2596_04035 [Syntrophorhabdaceae bacterium]|nr:hypothetical protein [Syntrophorhabdaceae bacterium]
MKFFRIFIFSLFLLAFFFINAYGDAEKKEIDIKRDREKTVYTIGSTDINKEKDQTEDDRKNSWDMLKNMNIRIDKR